MSGYADVGYIRPTRDGNLIGEFQTLAVVIKLGLRRYDNTNGNPRAPRFDIMGMMPNRQWKKVGALFEQVARATGQVFYTGYILDPITLPQKVQIALFDDGASGFNIKWRIPQTNRQNAFDGLNGAPEDEPGDDFEGAPADDSHLAAYAEDKGF